MKTELYRIIKQHLELAIDSKKNYAKYGHGNQFNYARGQIDSFEAVLKWIKEIEDESRS